MQLSPLFLLLGSAIAAPAPVPNTVSLGSVSIKSSSLSSILGALLQGLKGTTTTTTSKASTTTASTIAASKSTATSTTSKVSTTTASIITISKTTAISTNAATSAVTSAAKSSSTSASSTTSAAKTSATAICGQYQSQTSGGYSLYTNGWGWSDGNGSQCAEIDSVSGNSLAWSTRWNWTGVDYQVKSYSNVQKNFVKKQLSDYTSIPTTWNWNYTGTNVSANVAYDTFFGSTASVTPEYEVMVWLGAYGDISPLSDNGYPFTSYATLNVGGVDFDLAHGYNADGQVFSFVAQNHSASYFNGDLLPFYQFLADKYATQTNFTSNLYLQSIQAGTEVFTGSNAQLTTSAYTISVN